MPWENIGSCGIGDISDDRAWIIENYNMALSYLKFVLEPPPEGCSLDIMWQEHELGDYPSIGLFWDETQLDPPWDYLNRCTRALEIFDDAIDWYAISPDSIAEKLSELDEEEDDDEYDDQNT